MNDKDADQTAHLQSGASIEGADLHAYHTDWREQQRNRSVYSFAQSEGNDRCRSACSSMKFSANNNSAKSVANNRGRDQPAQLQSLVQTMTVQISLLICAGTNNSVDQPAHLHSLRLAFGMLTNVGPTR